MHSIVLRAPPEEAWEAPGAPAEVALVEEADPGLIGRGDTVAIS